MKTKMVMPGRGDEKSLKCEGGERVKKKRTVR